MSFAVGMLDWGIGGIGVLRALRARRPDLSVLYWSDTGAVPYGRLDRAALTARVGHVLGELVRRGARHLIVACNAASTALPELVPEVPCLGMIEPAIAMVPPSLSGTLAVVGGVRTIRSGIYQRALTRPGLSVVGRVAQPISAHIEGGTAGSQACADDLARIMRPLRTAEAILFACTHYPALAGAFRAHAPEALWLDPADAVAEQAVARFELADGPCRFVTSGEPEAMRQGAARAFGVELPHVERGLD
jgi:glutamate racemase